MPKSPDAQARAKRKLWTRRIGKWQRSGMEVRAFCRWESVPESAFYWWRRRLAQEEKPSARTKRPASGKKDTFVPVRLTHIPQTGISAIELVLPDGSVVRIPPEVNAQRLRGILEAVSSSSC
jgi:hypothetical protein